eukprot:c10285_g1_i3.p1 GENE.c10285_g1_i3~~c10285_g1_i3.p1  ORF type:complete len:232 (+),score=56.89 c10285_g1_i3:203-898(+)
MFKQTTVTKSRIGKPLKPNVGCSQMSKLGDLATALEACHTLETISNAQLVERQRQLQAHFRDLVEDLQKHKSKIEELVSKLEVVEAMPLQNRTPKQLKEDEDVRGIFDLGPDQFLICEHTCTHNDASGKVFLTPGFLCFGASRDTSNNFKVSYHDIGLVEKVQRKNRLGVDVGKGIKVTMEDSTEYVFSAFPNRSIAFRDILSQGTFHSLSWALNIGESSRSSLPIADEKV